MFFAPIYELGIITPSKRKGVLSKANLFRQLLIKNLKKWSHKVTLKKTLLTLLSLFLVLAFIGCSENTDQQSSSPTSSVSGTNLDTTSASSKDRGSQPMALATATAQVSIKGPKNLSYTVQFKQGNTVVWQSAPFTMPLGKRVISGTVTAGYNYTANAWVNGIGVQSHTWPSQCVSGTTHLGCLQFDTAGDPTPWTGSCP